MIKITFFLLGSVVALITIGLVIVYQEDKDRYGRVQKRNEERNKGRVFLNRKTGQYES